MHRTFNMYVIPLPRNYYNIKPPFLPPWLIKIHRDMRTFRLNWAIFPVMTGSTVVMYTSLHDAERVANAGTSGRIIETADVMEKPGTGDGPWSNFIRCALSCHGSLSRSIYFSAAYQCGMEHPSSTKWCVEIRN